MVKHSSTCTGLRILLRLGSFLLAAVVTTHAAANAPLRSLSGPGHVVLLRHANAPGVGEPGGFKLEDCRTQRNLDQRGRAQASALGERLRAAGLRNGRA